MFKFSIYEEPKQAIEEECVRKCKEKAVSCPNTGCEMWMNHEEDLNCCLVAVDKNPGGMTLQEVGDRLGITCVRVHQIEKQAVLKMRKRSQKAVSVK